MIEHNGPGQGVGTTGSHTIRDWSTGAGPAHSRIIDHLLGGKDNLEPDQDFCARLHTDAPRFAQEIHACREIMLRAAWRLAEHQGVGQFVVLACGFPASPDVHDVLDALDGPPRHTLYLDPDDVVAAHGRAFLNTARSVFAQVDLRDAAAVLHAIDHSESVSGRFRGHLAPDTPTVVTTPLLSRDEPIALLLGPLLLDRLSDHEAAVMAELIGAIPHGYVVVSHLRADSDADRETITAAMNLYTDARLRLMPRSTAQVTELLTGTDEFAVDDQLTLTGPVPVNSHPDAPARGVLRCFATTIGTW